MRPPRRDEALCDISSTTGSPDPSDQAWAALGAAIYEAEAAKLEDSDDYLTAAEVASEDAYDRFDALSPATSCYNDY